MSGLRDFLIHRRGRWVTCHRLGNRSSPVVSAPEGFLLPHAADLNQAQPEAGLSFMGDLAGGLFPAIPLTPVPAAASRHGGESDAVGGPSGGPNFLVRGHSTYTRIIRVPPPLRSSCRTPRGVCLG